MASSGNDSSDSSGTDEQKKQQQSETQNQTSANGAFQPGMPAPPTLYMMPRGPHEEGPTMAQAAYPYVDPYYGNIITTYGGQAMMHPHMMGVLQPGVPLPTDAVEEPVYVNAKQYHGILRRRQSRAKAESENKLIKCRKPYLHESRHLHALKRARGCGGRFLNSKSKDGDQEEEEEEDRNQSCNPPSSSSSEKAACQEKAQKHTSESNKTESRASAS